MRWWRVVGMVLAGVAVLSGALALSAVAVADRAARMGPEPLDAARAEAVAVAAGAATVAVKAQGCEATVAGSGFLLDGRVVTSRHLTAGAATLTVDGPGARSRVAVAAETAADSPADLAISSQLGLDRPGLDRSGRVGLELASGAPPDGAGVVIVGRPGGRLRWLVATARTIDGTAYGAPGPLLLLDRTVAPGWSGGPVVDRAGRVVGVVRAVDDAAGVTLAVPVSQLHDWLRSDSSGDAPTGCNEAGGGG